MRTISYSEARQNLSATMMKAVEDHAPILITRQNGEACVLMSLEEYNSLEETALKWFTEFGHLNRGDMLTSEQHRCHNEKKKFQRRV
ncbi:hypothetical protein MY010_34620 [Escherichia coli]|nr:hypothetical protein MY010_34620 [Escherichia coli]